MQRLGGRKCHILDPILEKGQFELEFHVLFEIVSLLLHCVKRWVTWSRNRTFKLPTANHDDNICQHDARFTHAFTGSSLYKLVKSILSKHKMRKQFGDAAATMPPWITITVCN